MFFHSTQDHALITIYGDSEDEFIAKSIKKVIADRDVRIMTPGDPKILEQAALNSSLVFIGLRQDDDPAIKIGADLMANRLIAADIIAFCLEDITSTPMQIMGKGFSGCIDREVAKTPEYKTYLQHKISLGNRRLSTVIQEEEYRRMSDALSCAPASMIIFDQNKRAVFVSDHYYRAYPKIAARLIRGLSVYDAFDLMMKEEGIDPKDPRFNPIQKFWHNMEGRIEFTLNNRTTYSMKAVKLPNNRGTVIVGQNVTMYRESATDLQHAEYQEKLPEDQGIHPAHPSLDLVDEVVSILYDPIQNLMTCMADLEHDTTNPNKLKITVKEAKEQLDMIEKLYEKIEKMIGKKTSV